MKSVLVASTLSALSLVSGTVLFKETFDDKWKDRWVVPGNWKPKEEMGEWKLTSGLWYGDAKNKGIQVRQKIDSCFVCGVFRDRIWALVELGSAPRRG